MRSSLNLVVEVSEKYDFNRNAIKEIEKNKWAKNQWPLVYFLENERKKVAYVGESTNFLSRIKDHLANKKKAKAFNKVSIIGSDEFNKSATLDIESMLIRYISAEETYKLLNGNHGLINHNYFQQEDYQAKFRQIWDKLIDAKIVTKSIKEIENSDLFKYSPYKSLNKDQYNSALQIISDLATTETNQIFVTGSAGTGKTILATYLLKLLCTDISIIDIDELNEQEKQEIRLIDAFQKKYDFSKIAIVVAMTSLRKTLRKVFGKIPGLKASMVISPSETFKKEYDLLIVDEAHRLRQYKNISWRGAFKKNNERLGLDDTGTELDWIFANSKKQLFFYDSSQSIRPSDIDSIRFQTLLQNKDVITHQLKLQMRVLGGIDYLNFVDELLNSKRKNKGVFIPKDYDLFVFDDLNDLYEELKIKEEKYKLCRLIAGYSWEWVSTPQDDIYDIEIDDLTFKWNTVTADWINSENAIKEIGCIHTVQGYDLNYTGIIFGKEIYYNNETNSIEVDRSNYFDTNGKIGVEDIEDLKSYIINIYKTVMYRGIRGTFVYACDKNLRDYFKRHIATFEVENNIEDTIYEDDQNLKIVSYEEIKSFKSAIPYYDITVAAGDFSELQEPSNMQWVELPSHIKKKDGYFVCKVVGESMNKRIPNGALCLFQQNTVGSRNGKIVLVKRNDIQDADFGAGYTIKSYHSEKVGDQDHWKHKTIILKPMSTNTGYEDIVLKDNDSEKLEVLGEFVRVLE